MRAVELVDDDADRPMMLGWTNLAQGAGASISPLIAASVVGTLSVPIVLTLSFVLRLLASMVLSGKSFAVVPRPVEVSARRRRPPTAKRIRHREARFRRSVRPDLSGRRSAT